jgi:peptide/nickel transport system permease protein
MPRCSCPASGTTAPPPPSNGLNYLFDGYWWMVYPPAIILVITLLAFNLVGEAVRDSLDVRLQRR